MSNQNSHTDPNDKLAREIGQLLEEGRKPEQADDPLSDRLHAYKQLHRERVEQRVSEVDSERLWNRIRRDTTESPAEESAETSTTVYSLYPARAYRWAAAALVLIAVLASYFYYSTMYESNLVASAGSQITQTQLPGGSAVTLRPHSELRKLTVNRNKRSYRLSGEALFEVASQKGRPFSVRTDGGRVTVTGTRFTLSSWGRKVRVLVQEGSVKFDHPGDTTALVLNQGEAAEIGRDTTAPRRIEINRETFTDWLDQQAIFNNEKARYVFAELEQHFGISIEAPEPVMNKRLSGRVSLEQRGTALEDLGLVLGGTFKKSGQRAYTFIQE